MAHPPKVKGTHGEVEVVELLQYYGIDAHRSEASRPSHDIRIDIRPDVPIEVKFRKTWALHDWIRKCRRAADRAGTLNRWAIFAIHGDRRTTAGSEVGRVMVVDAEFGAQLLRLWLDQGGLK